MLIGCRSLFSDMLTRYRLLQPLLKRLRVSPELTDQVTLATQSLERFILCKFAMADLGLQIVRQGLRLGQRPLCSFAGGGFSR